MSIVSSGQITITDLSDGNDGVDGKDGIAGKDGVGVKNTVITYSTSTSGTTAPTTGWTSSVPSLVKGQYLWTKTVWTYTDNSSETGYSVSYISKDGNNGTDGIAGKDGVGISNTIIEYVGAASGTSKPTSGWSTTIPTVPAGQYLWTRTTWQYTDGTSEYGFTNALMGREGASGKDGLAGKDGVGIKSTQIMYAQSTSGTTAPATDWTAQVPTLIKGQYLWTQTTWVYTDNTGEAGYTVSYISKDGNNGTDGVAGKDGVGIKTTTITYASHTNGTTAPTTGYTTAVPSVPAGQFLWTKTVWTYTDNTSETGYSVAMMGLKGDKGDPGNDGTNGIAGKDGNGIKATAITYQPSTNGTAAPTGTWSASVPTVAKGSFLWTRTIWTYTDNTTETGYAVAYMGTNGNNGTNGLAGKDGVGIQTTTITYVGSTSGTTAPTSGWTSTVPTVAAGSYLWTKTVWGYTDNTSETGYSVARMGLKGDKGDQGTQGLKGTNGTNGTNGQDAITIVMTNDNVTLPANAQGGVLSYANSGTTFSVLVGNIQCIPLTSTPVAVENSFSVVSSGSGIGVGSKTVNATDKVISYGNHASMSATSGATATITYTVTVRVNGANTTFTKIQNFSKSEKGITGDDGVDSYTYFRYSPYSDGKDMTSLDNADTKYMGICVTTSATAPSSYSSYKWSKYAGNDANKYGDNVIFNPKWDNVPYGDIAYNRMVDVGWNIGGGTGKLLAPESDAPSENIFELNVNNTYITSKGIPVVSGERYMFSLDIKTTNFGSGNDAPIAFRMFPQSNDAKIISTNGNNYECLVRVNGGTAGMSTLLDTTAFPIINDSNWNQRAFSFQIPDGVAYIRPILWHKGVDGTSTKLRKLELRKIQQGAVTKSATEPSYKYVGMQWQYTGASAITIGGIAIQPSTVYIWSGSVWQLYIIRSTNLQVDNAFITNAMIANAAIDSAKIKSVDAVKINADKLSSISADFGDIIAGTVKLMASSNILDSVSKNFGTYLSNRGVLSSGPTLATSSTFSTSNMGVANLSNGELRFIKTGFTENLAAIQSAGMNASDNAFIRFEKLDADTLGNLTISSNGQVNLLSVVDGQIHNYLLGKEGLEIFPNSSNTGNYLNSSIELIGMKTYIDFHYGMTSDDYSMRIINDTATSLSIMRNGGGYGQVKASAFTVSSSKEFKRNIREIEDNQLDKLMSFKFKKYRRHDGSFQIGLILDDVMTEQVTDSSKTGIDLYSLTSVIGKAVQELSLKIKAIEERNDI